MVQLPFSLDKKKTIIFGVVAIVVLLIGVFVLMSLNKPKDNFVYDSDQDYSRDPRDWINEVNDTVEISIPQATNGMGMHLFTHERYIDTNGEMYALHLEGNYLGNAFKRAYVVGNETYMRIWPEINPNDGIRDAFALFKKEDGKFVLYLFVDQDWKDLSDGNINIIWGQNIRDYDNLHVEPFKWEWQDEGIYYTRITEDIDWFYNQNPIVGRLFFGELTLGDVRNKSPGLTFVILV